MHESDELRVPNSADDEARAAPIVAKLANAIGALAAAEGFISPIRLETTMTVTEAIGKLLGEPSLTRVLVLRALSSPLPPRTAIADLKAAAETLPAPERAAVMDEFAPLIEGDSRSSIAANLAGTLDVRLPNHPARWKSYVRRAGVFCPTCNEVPPFRDARTYRSAQVRSRFRESLACRGCHDGAAKRRSIRPHSSG